ncbi:crotonobetaine/carnitine-CoA ligase [Antricoccus suffuscus]|uniref:Crotonobetaine/carnitine-CoA ligase n=1 Tax=Antricoccus suffuscus TaxID=1629062 RepID=A0A2T0ZS21_9ACTN|nr:AMP-binding protein [Antricoccus suffuscus]PRZ39125.1 crotonobetaine/carnitine-CoA ligase [Antricoccus suffuscus]
MTVTEEQSELVALLEYDGATIVEAIDRNARERGDRLALHYGETGERLNFAQFGALTDNVAGNLHRMGLDRGSRVSVLTTNPMAASTTMVGIWKAGCVYAPVNFQYSGALLAYQLGDTAPDLLIVDAALLPTVAAVWGELTKKPIVAVIGDDPGIDGIDVLSYADLTTESPRPQLEIAFDDPANIVYTSGTTGPSKGVLQNHRWITQYTWGFRRRLTDDDILYNDLPMYHVGGAIANVGAALWVGAGSCLWDRFSPSDFWRRITDGSCTMAILLDVMIPWLSAAPEQPDDRNNPLNKAHMQPLPIGHQAFAQRFGIDTVSAGFGQTESGALIFGMLNECEPGSGTPETLYRGKPLDALIQDNLDNGLPAVDGAAVTRKAWMGKAGPFVEVAILDERDQPVAPGTVGHLALRSKLPSLLFVEYIGKPEKTVEAWSNLWFHTGDSAMQDETGDIFFMDRLGDRIRVRGENVSSVHVEDLVGAHPAVGVCAVVGVPSAEGNEDDIAAFVQLVEGATVTEEELRAHSEKQMPKFMRPKHYRIVTEIPKTPTNKIEKHKLRMSLRAELEKQRDGGS